jgi:hypothetical protein
MKRALLILSCFGYVMFLLAGTSTGSGVYRTPGFCLAAVACAAVATACVPAKSRWSWSVAGVAALVCSLYGYQQNSKWRAKLDLTRGLRPPTTEVQTDTNR